MSGSFAPALKTTSVSIAFTDGDNSRRVTISDAQVLSTSSIVGAVRRPNNTDATDVGFIYSYSIVNITAGSFDVLITATTLGADFTESLPPSETITFTYIVGG